MKLTDADNAADGIFFPALEQNMMGAVLINENDEVMFFNPAAEKLWGYKREEVIGNNIDMLIPRDLRPAHPQYIRHNREGGKARVEGMSRELQLEKKDGSKIWTRFALSKVSAEGKVYYLALVRDASVEMAQKEQTRQLIIAVDHLDRPVIVLDPERHIVQCNRAFTEMFGYCINEASGMQPDTLLNIPEFPADNRIRLQQLLWKTARDQDEFLLLTRTGEKIWIKASISPVYDVLAHLQNLVMTFSDITEERQIRQLEGNILAAMCSSPPFHEMGEIICRNIESVLNESHVSLFALRNGMPIHWASSSHGAEVQNAQSWSATIRQRDGAPDASSGNALRFQLVIQRNFRFQYLRNRASCFCFLDNAVKGGGINTRHRNFALQCDFSNRKTGIHFIQRDIGGGINRCWRESRFPQH